MINKHQVKFSEPSWAAERAGALFINLLERQIFCFHSICTVSFSAHVSLERELTDSSSLLRWHLGGR